MRIEGDGSQTEGGQPEMLTGIIQQLWLFRF